MINIRFVPVLKNGNKNPRIYTDSRIDEMSNELCKLFSTISKSTYDKLIDGKRVKHQLSEETLTDINILHLKLAKSRQIYSKVFNKKDEGKNGADWEWWLTDAKKRSWLGIRVQAKIINFSSNRFEHLHYKPNKTCYQSTILKRQAARNGLVPMYCLYTYPPLSHGTHVPCGKSCCSTAIDTGCFLMPIETVESLRRRRKANDLATVITNAMPLQCLFCSDSHSAADLPERAWGMLRRYFNWGMLRRRFHFKRNSSRSYSKSLGIEQSYGSGVRTSAPDYVHDIIADQSTRGAPEGLGGVMVIIDSAD